jgi:large subunit ribosomal protein L30
MEDEMSSMIKITLIRSQIGVPRKLRKVIAGLGLQKTQSSVLRKDTPEIRGMIFKIKHLVEVTEAED